MKKYYMSEKWGVRNSVPREPPSPSESASVYEQTNRQSDRIGKTTSRSVMHARVWDSRFAVKDLKCEVKYWDWNLRFGIWYCNFYCYRDLRFCIPRDLIRDCQTLLSALWTVVVLYGRPPRKQVSKWPNTSLIPCSVCSELTSYNSPQMKHDQARSDDRSQRHVISSQSQWCKRDQKSKTKIKTKVTRPRPRPPEVNKSTWRI